VIWNFERDEKIIYLTFDDGPIPELTDWVLDQLKLYNAKATFFCVGANIIKHKQVYDRIINEGHVAGNHTMYHSKGFIHKVEPYINEAEDCKLLVGNNLFRPPYGQLKRGQYRELIKRGYKVIMWDVISYDYEKIAPKKCARNAINHTRNGSIVLFHDNIKAEKNLKYTLPLFLRTFSEKGYQFKGICCD
jgi:peptidoglycan-N-acetylglucosamine deacetylase